jgi:hypothetical protein
MPNVQHGQVIRLCKGNLCSTFRRLRGDSGCPYLIPSASNSKDGVGVWGSKMSDKKTNKNAKRKTDPICSKRSGLPFQDAIGLFFYFQLFVLFFDFHQKCLLIGLSQATPLLFRFLQLC